MHYHTGPADNPAEHQGRHRSRPYVDGDYTAHVYIEGGRYIYAVEAQDDVESLNRSVCSVRPSPQLRTALEEVISSAQEILNRTYPDPPTIFSALKPASVDRLDVASSSKLLPAIANTSINLHISLTHPLPLRAHQIPLLTSHLERHAQELYLPTSSDGSFNLAFGPRVVAFMNGSVGGSATDQSYPADEVLLDEEEDRERFSLDNLGTAGTGQRNRAFIALRVSTGHDIVSRSNNFACKDRN